MEATSAAGVEVFTRIPAGKTYKYARLIIKYTIQTPIIPTVIAFGRSFLGFFISPAIVPACCHPS